MRNYTALFHDILGVADMLNVRVLFCAIPDPEVHPQWLPKGFHPSPNAIGGCGPEGIVAWPMDGPGLHDNKLEVEEERAELLHDMIHSYVWALTGITPTRHNELGAFSWLEYVLHSYLGLNYESWNQTIDVIYIDRGRTYTGPWSWLSIKEKTAVLSRSKHAYARSRLNRPKAQDYFDNRLRGMLTEMPGQGSLLPLAPPVKSTRMVNFQTPTSVV